MTPISLTARHFVFALFLCLSAIRFGQAVEPKVSDSIVLAVWVSGTTAHFKVENLGSQEVLLHKALTTPYGWPESCWIQVRDHVGKIIVTRETDESGYWSPLFYAASANVLPVELQALPAGHSWQAESNLKDCIENFAAWPLIKENKDASESVALLKQVAAVKITLQIKLDRMLSQKQAIETDWIPFALWSDEAALDQFRQALGGLRAH